MIRILLLTLSLLFTQELEVQGNLKVSGDIDSPTIDALSGMKPERIYRYVNGSDNTFSFTVPEGKIWYVHIMNGRIKSQGWYFGGEYSNGYYIFIQNDIIQSYYQDTSGNNNVGLNIYEYSISGSGTDQGMDYIEP